jgi:hypothetical protein
MLGWQGSAGRPAASALGPLDDLDPVAVGIAHEAQARAALAHAVGRLLRLDPLLGEAGERRVEVLRGDRDVAVAGADLVRLLAADVVRQLQARRVAVARHVHEHVDRLVADRHATDLLEPERLVEGDRAVDVEDPVARVDEGHAGSLLRVRSGCVRCGAR